jgi:hypothetical protein
MLKWPCQVVRAVRALQLVMLHFQKERRTWPLSLSGTSAASLTSLPHRCLVIVTQTSMLGSFLARFLDFFRLRRKRLQGLEGNCLFLLSFPIFFFSFFSHV